MEVYLDTFFFLQTNGLAVRTGDGVTEFNCCIDYPDFALLQTLIIFSYAEEYGWALKLIHLIDH